MTRRIVRPSIEIQEAPSKTATPAHTVLFIHGIHSSHWTFQGMYNSFREDLRFHDWATGWFDYDFSQPIPESAKHLGDKLKSRFGPGAKVTLVCHSMGGLVARFAILSEGIGFVKRLIMLGTPNFGAVRTSKLATAALFILSVTRHLYAIFGRKPGVLDLTRVNEIFEPLLVGGKGDTKAAEAVEYITVPGLFFHKNRGLFTTADRSAWKGDQKSFEVLGVGFELLGAYYPLLKVGMEKPHDGIVEELSTCLIPPEGDNMSYYSEKDAQVRPDAKPPRYAHLAHRKCQILNHVTLLKDTDVMTLVRDLVVAQSINEWYASCDKGAVPEIRIPGVYDSAGT